MPRHGRPVSQCPPRPGCPRVPSGPSKPGGGHFSFSGCSAECWDAGRLSGSECTAALLTQGGGGAEAELAPPACVTPSLDVGAGSLVTLSLRPGCSCQRGRAACPLKVCILCGTVHEVGFSCQRRGAGGPCSILCPRPLFASFSGFVFGFLFVCLFGLVF